MKKVKKQEQKNKKKENDQRIISDNFAINCKIWKTFVATIFFLLCSRDLLRCYTLTP